MFDGIKRNLEDRFSRIALEKKVTKKLVRKTDSFLHSSGWIESFKRGYPCDSEGAIIPWMNYPVVEFLKERLHKDLTVFEFGSGYSTIFYAKLAKRVVSVEHDVSWYEKLKPALPENVELRLITDFKSREYCQSVCTNQANYDLIVVDGRERVRCIKESIKCLSETGVVLLDDSNRERYQEGIALLRGIGLSVLNFSGMKGGCKRLFRTSIYYKPAKNSLGI
jgi:hypothetical protein